MTMSKESMIGWFLVALGFGLEVVFQIWNIDGAASETFKGLIAVGFALIGIKGLSDLKKGAS